MLVGLGNANFIINHKFTEKRQNNCETKKVDDRCTHREKPGILWEEHQGRKQRGCGEQSSGHEESPLGVPFARYLADTEPQWT